MNKSKKNAFRRTIMGETPTPERFQHTGGLCREIIKTDGKRAPATLRYRARWPSPLDVYRHNMIINRDQYEAGVQFWQAYHRAVSGWGAQRERARRVDSPAVPEAPEGVQRALTCVEEAYAILSSDMISVVIDVCAYAQPAASPQELSILRKGLGRLAHAWGLAADEVCTNKKR